MSAINHDLIQWQETTTRNVQQPSIPIRHAACVAILRLAQSMLNKFRGAGLEESTEKDVHRRIRSSRHHIKQICANDLNVVKLVGNHYGRTRELR